MKPKDVAARVGPFIFRPSKNGGLVALAAASKSRTRAHRRGGETRRGGALKIKRGGELTAFYILKPQVTLRKRLDLDAIATRAGGPIASPCKARQIIHERNRDGHGGACRRPQCVCDAA